MNNFISDAEKCKRNGWGVGTRLAGDEGNGVTVIEITAIGERDIMAKKISHDGIPVNERESCWTLKYRDWQEVGNPKKTLCDAWRDLDQALQELKTEILKSLTPSLSTIAAAIDSIARAISRLST